MKMQLAASRNEISLARLSSQPVTTSVAIDLANRAEVGPLPPPAVGHSKSFAPGSPPISDPLGGSTVMLGADIWLLHPGSGHVVAVVS